MIFRPIFLGLLLRYMWPISFKYLRLNRRYRLLRLNTWPFLFLNVWLQTMLRLKWPQCTIQMREINQDSKIQMREINQERIIRLIPFISLTYETHFHFGQVTEMIIIFSAISYFVRPISEKNLACAAVAWIIPRLIKTQIISTNTS